MSRIGILYWLIGEAGGLLWLLGLVVVQFVAEGLRVLINVIFVVVVQESSPADLVGLQLVVLVLPILLLVVHVDHLLPSIFFILLLIVLRHHVLELWVRVGVHLPD